MSVIAIRDGIMAVDTMVSRDGMVIGYEKKWTKVHDIHGGGFAAGFGSASDAVRYFDKLNSGETLEYVFGGIVQVNSSGQVVLWEGHARMDQSSEFSAYGCGDAVAMGAMATGANSYDAARASCKLVHGCGGDIYVLNARTMSAVRVNMGEVK